MLWLLEKVVLNFFWLQFFIHYAIQHVERHNYFNIQHCMIHSSTLVGHINVAIEPCIIDFKVTLE